MALSLPFGSSAAINYGKKAVGFRTDPYTAFNFHVEIDGIIVGGFTEISGLSMTTEVERKHPGGSNNGSWYTIHSTTYTDLVLSRGLSDTDMLYGWYVDVTRGKAEKKNMTIFLLDNLGTPITWWDIIQALPVKWDGPTLSASATSGGVATEKITMAYERFERPALAQGASTVRNLVSGALGLLG